MNEHKNPYGSNYVSVSAILSVISKPGLEKWKERVGKEYSDKVQQKSIAFGDNVHGTIKNTVQGVQPTAEMEAVSDSFKRWANGRVRRWVCQEANVVNHRFKYYGRLDNVAELMDGTIAIIELKTSKKIQESHVLQICAYSYATLENGETIFDENTRLKIVRYDQTSNSWKEHELFYRERVDGFNAFLAALDIYRWRENFTT